MSELRAAGIVVGTGALLASFVLPTAEAQPHYSVRSPASCDTCHIEPTGWANPELKDRRCSLDCQVCHVSPTGGGLRTTSGRFYGMEALPMFGHRPSSDAAPRNNPTDGGFRLLRGFYGWQPGDTPSATIPDRYGKLKPEPALSGGADLRAMGYFPVGETGDYPAFFPMEFELYGAWRPTKNLVLYADLGLDSTRADLNFLGTSPEDDSALGAIEYLRLRELFVKYDHLPYNLYVRAGRFAPPYGWRMADHTSFVRRDLGFDQNRQVYGIEAGINPNYPYANVALFYQGIDAWPGDDQPQGYGGAVTAGVRELGWQAGGNVQALALADGSSQMTVGPTWAVNFYPITYMGEFDFRHDGDDDPNSGLFAYHEVLWEPVRGVSGQLKFDWMDSDVRYEGDHRNRYTIGASVKPYTYVELLLQYRRTYQGGGFFSIGGDLNAQEALVQLHGWL